MSSQALGAWPRRSSSSSSSNSNSSCVARSRFAAHAALWWSGVAALLGIALLVALQAVLQGSVDQSQLRRAIKATQTSQARQCMALLGGRIQENCLLALNEQASLSAKAVQTHAHAEPTTPVSTSKPRTSP